MREIKFRAWVKEDGLMVYPNGSTGYCMICNGDGFFVVYQDEEWIKNNEFVIMQYTGLKDKNGKEIYDGDIVRLQDGHKSFYVVEWHDTHSCWIFRYIDNQKEYYHFEYIERNFGRKKGIANTEVIGNIHANPELLNAKAVQS